MNTSPQNPEEAGNSPDKPAHEAYPGSPTGSGAQEKHSPSKPELEFAAYCRLRECSFRLWSMDSLEQGLDEILNATIEAVHADFGNVQFFDESRAALTIAVQRGFGRDFLETFREVSSESGSACGRALRTGEPIVIEDTETDPPFAPYLSVVRAAGFRSVISVPLTARSGKPLGMISTHFREPGPPESADFGWLREYARWAAAFIERSLVENRLYIQNQRLNMAAEGAHLGTWYWDLQSKNLEWSNLCRLHLNFPQDREPTIELFYSAIHPDDRKRVERLLKRSLEQRSAYSAEYRVLWPDGHIHWINAQGTVFTRPDGALLGMGGITEDITDRKLTETALRNSESRFRALVEASSDVVYQMSSDWSEMRQLVGRDFIADTTAPSQTWLRQYIPVDEQDRVMDAIQAAIFGKRVFELEHRVKQVDGTQGWTFTRALPVLDATGEISEWLGMASDITDRKLAEVELSRMRLLLEEGERIAHLGCWEYQVANQTTVWSQGEFLIYGLDSAEGSPDYQTMLQRHIHPVDRKRLDDTFQEALRQQCCWELEFRILRLDGSVRSLHDIANPFFNDAGDLVKYIGISLDITEKKRIEEVLSEKQGQLALFIEHAPAALAMLDTRMHYLATSQRWRRDFGLKDVNIMGQSHYELLPELPEEWRSLYQRGLSGEIIRRDEDRLIRKDGQIQWLRWEVWPWRNSQGNIGGLMISSEDITRQKLTMDQLRDSEHRFQLAMDATEDGIWDWNLKTGDCYFSPGYFRMLGYEPESLPAISNTWLDLLHPDEHDFMAAEAQRQLQSGESLSLEFRLRTHDGEYRWIASRGKVVEWDPKGKPLRAVGTHIDITEQRYAREELEALNAHLEQRVTERTRQAEAATSAKARFLANMSHEIRNPLNSISVLTHLLTHDGLDDAQQQLAKKIQTNVTGLARLVDDILDFSKIEAGQIVLEKAPFSLSNLIEELKSLYAESANIKGLRMHWPESSIKGQLVGDSQRLNQILSNLISNAIKFTEHGDIWWNLSIEGKTPRTIVLNFQVMDTGIGIRPEAIPTLLQPFTQADSSITRRFGGTGLGLSICQRLIELMGGQLSISSTFGMGSAFSFTLNFPVAKEAIEEIQSHAKELDGLRVLVADDDPLNLDVMALVLEKAGARVFRASDGGQAFEWLRDNARQCDVVLMDIQMPIMDGITATRLIRNVLEMEDLPIWAITAGILPDQQQEALSVGINELIRKPINVDALIDKLAYLTKRANSGPGNHL